MLALCQPYLQIGGYSIKKGKIVFLNRKGEPLGEKEILDYTAAERAPFNESNVNALVLMSSAHFPQTIRMRTGLG